MEEIMKFVTDNYLWFVIGGVVIIMAVIGYFADKKGFGKPKKDEKVKSEETPVKNEDNVVVSQPVTEEAKVEQPVVTPEENVDSSLNNQVNDNVDNLTLDNVDTNVEDNAVADNQSVSEPVTEIDPFVEPTSSVDDNLDMDITPMDTDNVPVEPIASDNLMVTDNSVKEDDNIVADNTNLDDTATSDEENIWKF